MNLLFDLIFPPRCAHCLKALPAGALCASCRSSIKLHDSFFCAVCRARMPSPTRSLCHASAPYILGAAADYAGAVKDLILCLKFQGVRDAAWELAQLLADYTAACGLPAADMKIAPLPLSRRRERERGFNQTELIALELGARLQAPVLRDALRRTRHAPPQSQAASIKERSRNVLDVFEAHPRVRGESILLIDDVATSGATLLSAALALRAAGARKVIGLASALA